MIFFQSLLGGLGLDIQNLINKKIVFEGDSITNGVLVTSEQRWSTLFTQYVQGIEINQGVNSKVLHNGNSCGNPQFSNTNIPVKDNTYGLLMLALGVNDILYDNGTFTPENYKSAVIAFIANAKSKGWKSNEILVLSPYFLSEGANNGLICGSSIPTSQRHSDYVLFGKQAVQQEPCLYCDISTAYSDEDMADLIHPNTSGHSKLANLLFTKKHRV